MAIFDILQTAERCGISRSAFYTTYILPGIVKESGWIGKARFWDEQGILQAITAVEEYRKIRAEQREAAKNERIERAKALAENYKQGMTLEEIGIQERMTRERVRQLISSIGIKKEDGGSHKRAARNSVARAIDNRARAEKRCFHVYGCSLEEFFALTRTNQLKRHANNRLIQLYWHHRGTAQRQHTEWKFTLPQYAALLNGREHLFKRERNSLVLGRKDKNGPFSPENCEILTLAQNSFYTGGLKSAARKNRALYAKRLFDDGKTIGEIAKKMDVSKATVNMMLKTERMESA
jgi:DNA-binding CsgD family transcriptional regulator